MSNYQQEKGQLKITLNRQSLDKKESIIKMLSDRNKKLHEQIKLIEKAITQKLQVKQDKPKKRQSIIKIQENVDLLNKQLSNCYKKIKLYQYQVGKYQKLQSQVSPGQKLIQLQLQIKQKKQISDKMKHQMLVIQKQISDNAKKLGGNHQVHQNQKHFKQLNDQINFLKEMVKQYEEKQANKQKQLKKQYAHIKKVQNQFIQNGGSINELDQLKQKAINVLSLNQQKPKNSLQPITNQKNGTIQTNNEEQQIEDKSKLQYQNLLNQKLVLQKLNKNYQKQISEAEKSQTEVIQKNTISKQKLSDLQQKIIQLQMQISQQKNNILPGNMKPQALRSISTHQSAKIKSDMKNFISLHSKSSAKSRNLHHILKYQTVGMISKEGISFTDRNILGQVKLQTKIIGLIVYVDKQNQLINGIQTIYSKKKYGGQHLKKDRTSKNIPYKQEHFMCEEGDYIKKIGGTFNIQDKLESLSIQTNLKQKHSFGLMKNSKKAFLFQTQQNQFPVCIFGSMIVYKDTYRQYSTIEYLGIQIFSNLHNNDSQITSKKGSNDNQQLQQ